MSRSSNNLWYMDYVSRYGQRFMLVLDIFMWGEGGSDRVSQQHPETWDICKRTVVPHRADPQQVWAEVHVGVGYFHVGHQ